MFYNFIRWTRWKRKKKKIKEKWYNVHKIYLRERRWWKTKKKIRFHNTINDTLEFTMHIVLSWHSVWLLLAKTWNWLLKLCTCEIRMRMMNEYNERISKQNKMDWRVSERKEEKKKNRRWKNWPYIGRQTLCKESKERLNGN